MKITKLLNQLVIQFTISDMGVGLMKHINTLIKSNCPARKAIWTGGLSESKRKFEGWSIPAEFEEQLNKWVADFWLTYKPKPRLPKKGEGCIDDYNASDFMNQFEDKVTT